MIKRVLIALGIVVGAVVLILYYGVHSAKKLPDNFPGAFVASGIPPGKKVVVCAGNSITHGRVSHNYVDELAARHRADDLVFVNAGINSELAYNLAQRIDDIKRCKPHYVTILIGTNDALAGMGKKSADKYIKTWNLPQQPTREWFKKNLIQIVDRLSSETNAKLAILSLPPITEDANSLGYKQAKLYSSVIKGIATDKKVIYLPLNEEMDKAVRQRKPTSERVFQGHERGPMYKAIFSHYILGRSWNAIADRNGSLYLTDSIHLNKRGSKIVADLIDDFIRGK